MHTEHKVTLTPEQYFAWIDPTPSISVRTARVGLWIWAAGTVLSLYNLGRSLILFIGDDPPAVWVLVVVMLTLAFNFVALANADRQVKVTKIRAAGPELPPPLYFWFMRMRLDAQMRKRARFEQRLRPLLFWRK